MLKQIDRVPTHDTLFWPVIQAFRELDGSADRDQLVEKVSYLMGLPDDVVAVPHKDGPQSELAYRISWVESWLKWGGMLDNPKRGVWVLTAMGREATRDEVEEIPAQRRKAKAKTMDVAEPEDRASPTGLNDDTSWQHQLLDVLKTMPPASFERLAKLLLLQLGFSSVEVVGQSGDGGIDLLGMVKVNSVLSFKILVQCKRFKGTVGPGDVRDFRGAMQGRTDKALFITTGRFTTEAKRESARDGVPAIDLIDGESLAVLLKDLQIGVKTEMVERVSIEAGFFAEV